MHDRTEQAQEEEEEEEEDNKASNAKKRKEVCHFGDEFLNLALRLVQSKDGEVLRLRLCSTIRCTAGLCFLVCLQEKGQLTYKGTPLPADQLQTLKDARESAKKEEDEVRRDSVRARDLNLVSSTRPCPPLPSPATDPGGRTAQEMGRLCQGRQGDAD